MHRLAAIITGILMSFTSLSAEIVWDPAASTHNGTSFVELQAGVGTISLGFPGATNPAGAGITVQGVYAFGFGTAMPGAAGPTMEQTDLSSSALSAGTDVVLRFNKAETDYISFVAILGDASDPSRIGLKQLSSTQIEIRARIVDPVVSESNDPDAVGAAFGLVIATTPTLTESFNMRGTVFVTDMHWLDLEPPDLTELPQSIDDIEGAAAGIAAKGISTLDGSGAANFTAFMPESFFQFARDNGVDVTGANCLGYRAFVELTGSDDGFFKLNDPSDQPFVDAGFDIDGDNESDEMWRFRITNSTWSRQTLSFGQISSGAAQAPTTTFVWKPASSTYGGTAFVELQPGIGSLMAGLPSATNPVGAGVEVEGVYAFGFANAIPGATGPTMDQTDLGESALVAGTDLVLQFTKPDSVHISFIAMVGDASDPAKIGYKQLSPTEIEIRATIADPVLSETNNPDALDAAFGLIVFTTPTLTEAFNMRGTVFVTDIHWQDMEPPDFSDLPQGDENIEGMAAGIAARGISVTNGSGAANFTAFMPEDFFQFARDNGVDVTGGDCLGYRAFVELTGSDEGFFKLNDPSDEPFVDSGFDADGNGESDEMWRFRITNATWSRQVLSFGKVEAEVEPALATDFDANGRVDFEDFLLFASGFGKSSTAADFDIRFDLNSSGRVDFEDFLLFVADFGKSS